MIYEHKIMTVEEAKKLYSDARSLKIKSKNGIVEEVSYENPCIVCGKYHRLFSKAQKKCSLHIIGVVSKVITHNIKRGEEI